jgi:putative nucleotidyltransferase with HDIG domain
MDREDIRLAVRNIKNLPTLPVVVSRILEVADEAGSSARELAEIISHDQSVSAKVLNLANSAFYGFSRRIATIPQAVVVLGFDTVKSLALGVSVFQSLSQKVGRVSFDREQFWMHSIGCATAAKLVAKSMGLRDMGTPFVAGLLHDIGKVILDTYFNTEYQKVIEEMIGEGRSAVDVETDVLNIDHAEVGGWLAARWKFPDVLVAPIAYHHNLLGVQGENLNCVVMVHLANILTKKGGIGLNYEVEIPEPSDIVERVLRLTLKKMLAISEELNVEKGQIQKFFRYLNA